MLKLITIDLIDNFVMFNSISLNMFINKATLISIDRLSPLEKEGSNFVLNEKIIFNIINGFLKNNEIDGRNKVLLIANVISWVRSEELLLTTINLLKEFGWYKSEPNFLPLLDYVQNNNEYSNEDIAKIKSLIYSFALRYEVFIGRWNILFDMEKPKLELWVGERLIKTNIISIENYIRSNTLPFIIDEYIEPLDKQEQDEILNNLIYSLTKLDYKNNSDSMDKEISLLEKRVNLNRLTIESNKDIIDKSDSFFEPKGFEIFKKWMTIVTEEDNFKKVSFILQKLNAENLMRISAFKKVLPFLMESNFITKEEYDDWIIKNNWDTPSNIFSKGRLNNYRAIKESIL